MKNLEDLIRALDAWEAADDRANEAAAALSSPVPLAREMLEELRALQRLAAQKLEAVRNVLAADFQPSGF